MEVEHEENEKKYDIWRTTKFKIKAPEGQVKRFKERLKKRNKNGYYRIPRHEVPYRISDWIQKKMKPIDSNCSGEDWEESKKAFTEKMFDKFPKIE